LSTPPPPRLEETEITHLLPTVPHWHQKEQEIWRTFKFSDFKEAMNFVNQVATLAEKAAHHPDITIRWNQVTLTLSTHSQGGLTKADFDLASQIDTLKTSYS
jgi:4a-hydroxytetrahydrobiopterin dehydratase